MAEFEQLEQWAGALLAKLAPAARRKLARTIAQDLRRSQQRRILAQRNPDGSAFAPRKTKNLRGKAGRIKRKKLFTKIGQAKHLKATATGDAAVVAFTGRTERIARVHQFGLRDRVSRRGKQVRFPQRELLGFTDADRTRIRDLLIEHLTR